MPTNTTSETVAAFVPTDRTEARIELARVPRPRPAADQALIAVEAYSINRGEVFLLETPRPGWRPGQDVAGRVISAAADGSGPATGTHVVAHAWEGGWASQVAVATDALAELPDSVDIQTAATLPLAGLTALRLLRAAGSVVGGRLLITGASGGVGHALAELAIGGGAEVTAITSTPERGQRLVQLGARIIHDIEAAEDQFDVIFESVSGPVLQAALAHLRPGGLLLWFGQAGRHPVTLDFFTVATVAPGARIVPFSYWGDGTRQATDLATLVRLVDEGRLHPEIGLRDDWVNTPRALLAVRDRLVRGNAVLTVSTTDPLPLA
jgi:NADPH:quinone reductase-like Zn-dependent oxidoreductase